MKTLLFNGCSYVAGDAIVWDRYCRDVLKHEVNWLSFVHTGDIDSYFKYRAKLNLSAQTAALCHTTSVDLSKDGASNAYIALTTIKYLTGLTTAEQKNIHVCIGWTEESRRFRWDNPTRCFINLNVNSAANNPNVTKHIPYMKSDIVNSDPADHYLDYFKHVMLLENFLIRHNIKFTFWRSLGFPINLPAGFEKVYNINSTSANNWIKFDKWSPLPAILDISWMESLMPGEGIDEVNKHPNAKRASEHALLLSKMILLN